MIDAKVLQARLHELLSYNPETGVFTWRVHRSGRGRAGVEAGTASHGYRVITVDWVRYPAHRLVFVYLYGRWPAEHVDHRDGDPLNNRPGNLRECSHAQNHQNTKLRVDNSTGMTGVCWDRSKRKFMAYINIDGKRKNLGRHATAEAAYAVYLNAKANLHTFQPVPRRDAA